MLMANFARISAFDTDERQHTVLAIRSHARDLTCALLIDAIKFEID